MSHDFRFWPHHETPDWAEHLAHHLSHGQEQIMATIADLTAVVTAVQDAVNRVDSDLQALKDSIGNATSLSPDDQAALDGAVAALQGSVDAINTTDPGPDNPPPPPVV